MSVEKTMLGQLIAQDDRAVLMRVQGGRLLELPLARIEPSRLESPFTLKPMPEHLRIHTEEDTGKDCGLVE